LNANAGFPLGPNPVGLVDTPFFSDITYRFKQYAAFGEATYRFTDQWALTGGLRYYKFQEDRVLHFNGVFAGATAPAGVPGSVDSSGVSPRGIVTYKVNEDAQFNAQVSKGFRLGGINDPINIPLCSPEDKVEFGGQGNWRMRRARTTRSVANSAWRTALRSTSRPSTRTSATFRRA
jgi:iron complex outermembrane recepter protein